MPTEPPCMSCGHDRRKCPPVGCLDEKSHTVQHTPVGVHFKDRVEISCILCTATLQIHRHTLANSPPDSSTQDVRETAWDEGFDAGHQFARAVNTQWPAPPSNPYRSKEK